MLPLRDNLGIRQFPYLTALLVAINVLVFFTWQTWGGGTRVDFRKVVLYGEIPYQVTHPGKKCVPDLRIDAFRCDSEQKLEQQYHIKFPPTWETLFTSMFMHMSIVHLVGNMLFLIVFGISLEAGLGRRSFALFYLIGGLGADLGHTLFDPSSPIPALGASGAISAVMGGYVMLYPRAKIFTWIIPGLPLVWGWIRASLLIGILMGLQVVEAYFMLSSAYGSGGGVAYFAHFGGFAAGAVLVLVVLDRESIERLRRQARIASGDERPTRDDLDLTAEGVAPSAAVSATQPYGQPAYAQQAAGQAAYGQVAVAAAPYGQPTYAQAGVAPSAYRADPFAPAQPVTQPPASVPPRTSAPQPPAAVQPQPLRPPPVPSQPSTSPPAQPYPPPPPSPASRPRPAPGSVPRPPGC